MKKTCFFFLFFILCSHVGFAQICKRNVIDCPGICKRFTDKDSDKICDFSPRSAPITHKKDSGVKTVDATKVSKTDTVAVKSNLKEVKPETKIGITGPLVISAHAAAPEKQQTGAPATPADTLSGLKSAGEFNDAAAIAQNNQGANTGKTDDKPYPLITIILLTLSSYFITYLLVKFNVIKKVTHRKIWNTILLLTFLMSGILGLLLVFQLNYRFWMNDYMTFLTLHVDFGIAMAIISIFHTAWHLSYYLNLFGNKKKKKSGEMHP